MTEPMLITVDRASWVPAAEQIRGSIGALAARGALPVGHPLPTVRQLARDLGLAAGTVARAYRALETDGVIETHGRRGSFIAAGVVAVHHPRDALIELARRYLADATGQGATPQQAAHAVHSLLED